VRFWSVSLISFILKHLCSSFQQYLPFIISIIIVQFCFFSVFGRNADIYVNQTGIKMFVNASKSIDFIHCTERRPKANLEASRTQWTIVQPPQMNRPLVHFTTVANAFHRTIYIPHNRLCRSKDVIHPSLFRHTARKNDVYMTAQRQYKQGFQFRHNSAIRPPCMSIAQDGFTAEKRRTNAVPRRNNTG